MLKSFSLPAPLQSLSMMQRLLLLLGGLLIFFLIIGSFNEPTADDFVFGIQRQPFHVLAFLAFAGGLLSFISPCTLPVLTAYFAFAFQSDRKQIAANTLAFMIGLGTTFSLLGAVSVAIGQALRQSQNLILLIGGAVVLIFGVMSLLGQGFGGFETASQAQPRNNSIGGSYLFGVTFAVGWSSCIGPILGAVMGLAAQSGTVWNGMMLLFIYTLGLGLPLLVVSTLFGRMSRKSLFWRLLRGKGWEIETHLLVVALVWALAIWRILAAMTEYAFRNFEMFAGQTFSSGHEWGLLVLAVLGAFLWVFTGSEKRRTTIHLHTTQLISGALFVLVGILMLEARLALFNSGEFARWYEEYISPIEAWLLSFFE